MKLKICSGIFTTVVIFGFLFNESDAFSVSVPPVRSVCKSMTPGHDKTKAQQSSPPYSVTTDVTQVSGGNTVEGINK